MLTCGDLLCVRQKRASDARSERGAIRPAGEVEVGPRNFSRLLGDAAQLWGGYVLHEHSTRLASRLRATDPARINVDDDSWRRFRQQCLHDGEHVSEVLGRLVAAEVNRRRPPARQPAADKPAPKHVNASTREHAAKVKATSPGPAATSTSTTATTEVVSLFDQPDGDAPYT